MSTHYTRSTGERVEISGMLTEHLQAAAAKLDRDQPHRKAERDAMHAELLSRGVGRAYPKPRRRGRF